MSIVSGQSVPMGCPGDRGVAIVRDSAGVTFFANTEWKTREYFFLYPVPNPMVTTEGIHKPRTCIPARGFQIAQH